jgi:DNA-binding transcriptional LysR family regulator
MYPAFSQELIIVLDSIKKGKSFAQIGDELHKVPSAISYIIKDAESELQIKLIDRSTHKAKLTKAGESFLEDGCHVLELINRSVKRAKQIEAGWEKELKIAVDSMIPINRLFPMLKKFYAHCNEGIKLQLLHEVLGGTWDALYTGRADLVIGASGQVVSGGWFKTKIIGELEFIFAISPNHPLGEIKGTLSETEIEKHIGIVASDSSRSLNTRTSGIFEKQNKLALPGIEEKIQAQREGLGVGYLPKHLIGKYLKDGSLIEKKIDTEKFKSTVFMAWDSRHKGKALEWFISEIEKTDLLWA